MNSVSMGLPPVLYVPLLPKEPGGSLSVAKSYLYLLGACVAAIATVGSLFELSSGEAQLGTVPTTVILLLSVPLGLAAFITAVRLGRASDRP